MWWHNIYNETVKVFVDNYISSCLCLDTSLYVVPCSSWLVMDPPPPPRHNIREYTGTFKTWLEFAISAQQAYALSSRCRLHCGSGREVWFSLGLATTVCFLYLKRSTVVSSRPWFAFYPTSKWISAIWYWALLLETPVGWWRSTLWQSHYLFILNMWSDTHLTVDVSMRSSSWGWPLGCCRRCRDLYGSNYSPSLSMVGSDHCPP